MECPTLIAIADYGLGNVHAFANIYKRLNIPNVIASTTQDLRSASKIILPGVGAFDWAMTQLNKSGLRDTLEETVIGDQIPVLGVCVGMQMMANRSEEGRLDGLGWIDGEIKRFAESTNTQQSHIPHMGWNHVQPQGNRCLYSNLDMNARFYFLHSYFFVPDNQDHVLAVTDYNGIFASSVGCGNVFGVQFHPEKSHQWGIQLLKNFAES